MRFSQQCEEGGGQLLWNVGNLCPSLRLIFQKNLHLHHLTYHIACPSSFEVAIEVSYVNVTLFCISQLPEIWITTVNGIYYSFIINYMQNHYNVLLSSHNLYHFICPHTFSVHSVLFLHSLYYPCILSLGCIDSGIISKLLLLSVS